MQNEKQVKMARNGVEIDVSPDQAKNYLKSGWKEVESKKQTPIKPNEAK